MHIENPLVYAIALVFLALEKVFCLILLFSSPKSAIDLSVLSGLVTLNFGDAHSERLILRRTPNPTSLL